ncbi:MAG: hypothetical protein QW607_11410 [Desulfurococcaceae archaeon]
MGLSKEANSSVIRLPQEGELYEIKEKDALEEIEERARKIDKKSLRERIMKGIDRLLRVSYDFPKACENRTFEFIPWYSLPFDIRGADGSIIYPKGYTFNPLEYIGPMIERYTIVFFNGDSKEEIEWLKRSGIDLGNALTVLIAVRGDIRELVREFKRPIYVYEPRLMDERFRVKKTPSVVRFRGGKVIVTEVGIYKNCKK